MAHAGGLPEPLPEANGGRDVSPRGTPTPPPVPPPPGAAPPGGFLLRGRGTQAPYPFLTPPDFWFWAPIAPLSHNRCWAIVYPKRGIPFMALTPAGRKFRKALNTLATLAMRPYPPYPYEVDLRVALRFISPNRDAASGSDRAFADVDGPVKPVLDALTGAVYTNDRQVVKQEAEKAWAARGEPRIEVYVWALQRPVEAPGRNPGPAARARG